jgi:uracil-DNA glycosylase
MSADKDLKDIAASIGFCQNCPLFKGALNPVPGQGNPQAKVVFIGEGPGASEDQQGIPFCGRSGNLLDKLLFQIYLKRESVFITNIVKHRPPGNRDPAPLEIKACTPFLKKQLLVIKPQLIVTLGRFALNYFLPEAFISRSHGQLVKINWEGLDLTLLPLYHPAAALRNGRVLKDLQADFIKLGLFLGTIKRKTEGKKPAQAGLFSTN